MNKLNLASDSTQGTAARCRKVWVALFCALLVGAVGAQSNEGEADPPGRVGRISDLTGQVLLYSPGAGEWVSAVRNRPITGGDRLATDPGARAEVRIGSTTVRLDSATELEVLRIDDARIELQLHNGTVAVRLRSREAVDEFELRTGEGRFRAQRTGRYRIDRVDEASHLSVNSGTMVYEGPGSALTVYSGQRAEFWLDAANTAQYTISEPRRDAFAAWNSERDRNDDRSASTRYVSPEMTGVEDLDRHGRWEPNEEYGPLWIPRGVAAGWAPYSNGHWIWVSPWGWTWVDDAPWGFAPFHYGRWVWYRSNWCWAPGTRVLRPVYAPALVAWVGGPRASVSVSIGAPLGPTVGWFPLAPREIYVPSYRVSPRYVREVNVTHVTQITNVTQIINNAQGSIAQRDFSNRKFPHAVTVVPTSVMTQRQAVAPAAAQWRERHDSRDAIREVTRGATLVAAPVEAPPARSRPVESQLITAPGIGNAGAGAAPAQQPTPRIGSRNGDERRGEPHSPHAAPVAPGGAGPQRPSIVANPTPPAAPVINAPGPAVIAPAVISTPNRPAPSPAASPPAPQVAGAISNPQPPAAAPRAQAPAVAPAPGPAPRSVPAGPPAPNGGVTAPPRPSPVQEARNRPQRPPGNEVPAVAPKPEITPQPGPTRGNHAQRRAPDQPPEAARPAPQPKGHGAEQQARERAEQRGHDMRRDGRDRQQAN